MVEQGERAPVDEGRRIDARDLGEGRREVAVQDHGLDPLARRHARPRTIAGTRMSSS